MREIKFRVWYKENKEMSFYPEMRFDFKTGLLESLRHPDWEGDSEPENWTPAVDGWADPEDFEIMQFTGLHDKNGKEIYEGDIVQGHLKGGGEAKGRVHIKDDQANLWGLWIADGPEEKDFGSWDMRQFGYGIDEFTPHIEVIGNIYENPELLEGDHDNDALN